MTFAYYRVETHFDAQPVLDRLESVSTEILRERGAVIRSGIRATLRYGTKSSPPGQPPTLHRSQPSRRPRRGQPSRPRSSSPLERIVFAMPDPMTVDIGVAMIAGQSGNVPRIIEEGGTSVTTSGDRITVAPRPFMRPVFLQETMHAGQFWAGALSQG